jgi:hypothetical protein
MEMYMGDRCPYEDYSGYNFKKQIQGKLTLPTSDVYMKGSLMTSQHV